MKAKEQLNKVKRDIIMKQVKTETLKPLLFDDMIEGELGEIKFNKNIGEVASVLDGSLKQKIVFRYIRWDELMSAVYKFSAHAQIILQTGWFPNFRKFNHESYYSNFEILVIFK